MCDYIDISFRGQNLVVIPMERRPVLGYVGAEIEKVFIYAGGLREVDKLIARGVYYEPLNVVRVISGRVPDGRECVKVGGVTKGWVYERVIGWPGGGEEVEVVKPLRERDGLDCRYERVRGGERRGVEEDGGENVGTATMARQVQL